MKKTFYITTILCLFASVQLMGQCRLDTILRLDNGGVSPNKTLKGRTINAYKSGSNTIIETELSQTYNSLNGQWINSTKTDYIYNASNKVTQRVDQNWNIIAGTWGSTSKYEYAYLSDNLILYSGFIWSLSSSSWINSSQESYTYNGDNQVTESIYKFWNTSGNRFVNYQRKTFTYNSTTKLNMLIFEDIWNTSTTVWDKKYKTTTNRGFNLKPITIRRDEWDVASMAYYLDNSNYLKYNANDSLVEEKSVAYNPVSSTYDSSFKTIYRYNSDKRLVNKEIFKYTLSSPTPNKWVPNKLELFNYATDGRKTAKETHLQWDGGSKDYRFYGREEYKCFQSSVSIDKVAINPSFQIYPNPSNNETVFIDAKEKSIFTIYNSLGKIVLDGQLDLGKNSIAINGFAIGLYFISVNNQTQKLIIQ